MSFYVTEVIDGDTFCVNPTWEWNNESGDRVRALGYDTPEIGQPGFEQAKAKLERIILNKNVELKKPVSITYGRLLCEVYINGTDLATYF